jgi:hypothetical protein
MKARMLSLLLVMSVVFTACKKNETMEPASPGSEAVVQKAKDWFIKESNRVAQDKPATGNLVFRNVQPQWNHAIYFAADKQLIIPADINSNGESQVANATRYLVLDENSAGNARSGHYLYILGNGSQNVPADPGLVSGKKLPEHFTGTLVRYSMDGRFISSRHYENGVLAAQQDKLTQRTGFADPGSQSIVPVDETCHTETIDWYWQTYVNGVLVYEEYLYSTTTIVCDPSGGGGSGGGGISCEQQLQNMIEQGVAISGPAYSVGEVVNGDNWVKPYNWAIFRAGTWGLLSYEQATLQKKHYPNNLDRWEYTSFNHIKIAAAGASVGGTRTFEDNGATINISPIGTRVDVRIDFSVTLKVCNIPAVTNPYNANKVFFAPNTVVILHED